MKLKIFKWYHTQPRQCSAKTKCTDYLCENLCVTLSLLISDLRHFPMKDAAFLLVSYRNDVAFVNITPMSIIAKHTFTSP